MPIPNVAKVISTVAAWLSVVVSNAIPIAKVMPHCGDNSPI